MLTVSRVAAPTTPFPQGIISAKAVRVKNYRKKFTISGKNCETPKKRGGAMLLPYGL